MGREIVLKRAEKGVEVVVNGRNSERGKNVVNEVVKNGGRAIFVQGDVSLPETNRKLVNEATKNFGRPDILVMCAGELGIRSITEVDIDVWDRTIATNLSAVFYLLHYEIPEMQKAGAGGVVIVGSIAGFKVFPNHVAYCASKGTLTQLVKRGHWIMALPSG